MMGRNKRKRKEGHHDMDWTRDRNEHGCIQEILLVFYVEQDFILFQIFPQVLHTKVLWNFKAPTMWYSRTSSYSSQFSMSNWPHFLSYLIPSKHSGQWESSMAISMTVTMTKILKWGIDQTTVGFSGPTSLSSQPQWLLLSAWQLPFLS